MNNSLKLKTTISVIAFLLLAIRIWKPGVKIDTIMLGLIVIAFLPWIISLIESAKFPGGWEIKFREIKDSGNKIIGDNGININTAKYKKNKSCSIKLNSNLELVDYRIQLERLLRKIAKENGIKTSNSISQILTRLNGEGLLSDEAIYGLEKILEAGSRAAHGAKVEDRVADWVRTEGETVLSSLGGTFCARCSHPAVIDGKCKNCGYNHDWD